ARRSAENRTTDGSVAGARASSARPGGRPALRGRLTVRRACSTSRPSALMGSDWPSAVASARGDGGSVDDRQPSASRSSPTAIPRDRASGREVEPPGLYLATGGSTSAGGQALVTRPSSATLGRPSWVGTTRTV